jgi:hypothetical protein
MYTDQNCVDVNRVKISIPGAIDNNGRVMSVKFEKF